MLLGFFPFRVDLLSYHHRRINTSLNMISKTHRVGNSDVLINWRQSGLHIEQAPENNSVSLALRHSRCARRYNNQHHSYGDESVGFSANAWIERIYNARSYTAHEHLRCKLRKTVNIWNLMLRGKNKYWSAHARTSGKILNSIAVNIALLYSV